MMMKKKLVGRFGIILVSFLVLVIAGLVGSNSKTQAQVIRETVLVSDLFYPAVDPTNNSFVNNTDDALRTNNFLEILQLTSRQGGGKIGSTNIVTVPGLAKGFPVQISLDEILIRFMFCQDSGSGGIADETFEKYINSVTLSVGKMSQVVLGPQAPPSLQTVTLPIGSSRMTTTKLVGYPSRINPPKVFFFREEQTDCAFYETRFTNAFDGPVLMTNGQRLILLVSVDYNAGFNVTPKLHVTDDIAMGFPAQLPEVLDPIEIVNGQLMRYDTRDDVFEAAYFIHRRSTISRRLILRVRY